jgi:diguanylate cyclase (GGDEF)-like protein
VSDAGHCPGQTGERAVVTERVAAVLVVNLPGYQLLHDRHGHQAGDELLRAVSTRVSAILNPGDTVARLGGDEFIAVFRDLPDLAAAERVAAHVTRALAWPFSVGGHRVELGASVGVAAPAASTETVPAAQLRAAASSGFQSKVPDCAGHLRLDRPPRLFPVHRAGLERDLFHAERRGQFSLAYQPVVDLRGGRWPVVAVEALLRWQHPDRGPVGPGVVIPMAERTGLIVSVGEWVLRRACADIASWHANRLGVSTVAVNVSAHQLIGPGFVGTVERALRDTGARPADLRLEVTESVLLEDLARARAVLGGLRDLGVRLSLDDFGTGYSSLSYLHHLPVDNLKIDRSFTSEISTDRVAREIVSAMINLGHTLNLTVTAEGVETAGALTAVTDLGADHAQGYYLSRPLSVRQLTEQLHRDAVPAA